MMIDVGALEEALREGLPLLGVIAVGLLVGWSGRRFLNRANHQALFATQIWFLGTGLMTALVCILVAPVREETRVQLLSLFGLGLTALITLSSTTLVSNAMAGLMLRAVRSFRPGDFVRVEGYFGRVTERGLFHIEFQTRDRDLTTIPNLFLVNHPYTVVRESGTLVSASVTLGYDVSRERVESLLCEAARNTGLDDPFVYIEELGDFAVSYRISGFLEETRRLLTTRSDLRGQMLDALHRGGVEIVSPTFMNQRVHDPEARFVPKEPAARHENSHNGPDPEEKVFDKAEEAGRLAALRTERDEIATEVAELEAQLAATEGGDRYRLQRSIELRKGRLERIDSELG